MCRSKEEPTNEYMVALWQASLNKKKEEETKNIKVAFGTWNLEAS